MSGRIDLKSVRLKTAQKYSNWLLFYLFFQKQAPFSVPSNGRVDIVLLTDIRLYIIELKLNRDAQTALQQINLKNYAQRFALCGKPIVKVGINFDSTQGNIEDWIIEEE